MSKKIVFVQGSPRTRGNTRAITKVVIDAVEKLGAEVAVIDALKLNFKVPGCIDCCKCKTTEEYRCAIDDEVSDKVASLADYDVIVLVTPLYWWSYSAQLKIFIDRMYSLGKINDKEGFVSVLKGKTLALLATAAGGMEDNLEILKKQLEEPAGMMGCKFDHCLYPLVEHEEGSILNKENIKQAEEFAARLVE